MLRDVCVHCLNDSLALETNNHITLFLFCMKIKILLLSLVASLSLVFSACDDDHSQKVIVDLTGYEYVTDGQQIDVAGTRKLKMQAGTSILLTPLSNADQSPCVWLSTNPEVASVSENRVTAHQSGVATIIDVNSSAHKVYIWVEQQ